MLFAEGLKSSTQPGNLRRAVGIAPRPEVAKIAEVEVVGSIGRDVGGQAGYEVPRLLGATGNGCGCPELVAREHATDINLGSRRARQLVITIAGIEVPL